MAARRTNRRKTKQKKQFTLPQVNWAAMANIAAVTIVLAGVYQGTVWLMDQPIEAVRVQGTFQRVPSVRVEAAMADYLDEGFLSLDLSEVQARLADIPWVAKASIRRQWPGVLEVTVVEEQAAARWGKSGLLNTRGELFVEGATHLPVELPRLSGPEGSEQDVAQRYFELQKKLEQRGLSVVALSLDARGSWQLILSNTIEVRLGSNDIDQRVARLFLALDQVLAADSSRVAYIDMRYTNGFAVGWKPASARKASVHMEVGLESGPHG